MFRIAQSGSLLQCLAKDYKNDSIVSVDMDKVGVMAAYSDPLCMCEWFTVYEGTWQHILTCCVCVQFTVHEGTTVNCTLINRLIIIDARCK